MQFKRHYSIIKGELNMAPLIDVVLQQLIYFMLTSSFIMQPGIRIHLPQAATTERMEEREVVVSVSETGGIFFEERQVSWEQLERLFKEEAAGGRQVTVIIKGDQQARHGDVVSVMDRARLAGLNKIAIATMPELER
ncbi:MAG: biopolymer transporter ExbD [Candidatus Omnitrophica bacterium]|nr:biopolymer transporter ExbD [Candidatus Omnitrophota bacterium]